MLKSTLIKFVALGVLLFSTALSAHTQLQSSAPADGAKLNLPPAALQLNFTTPVRLMRVSLEENQGGPVGLDFVPSAATEKDFNLALPALESGEYTVHWIIMGADGHKMSGKFSFQVDTGK